MNDKNDLQSIVREHLDDGAPVHSSSRVDHDVGVLWHGRSVGRFGVAAIAVAFAGGAVVCAALVGAGVVERAAAIVGPLLPDDGEAVLTFTADGVTTSTRGTAALHAAWWAAGQDLPRFLGERTVRLHNLATSGRALLNDLVDADPGLSFVADACVDAASFDVVADNAPVEVVIDAAAARFGWRVAVVDAVVTVDCGAGSSGSTTLIDGTHPWPADDPALDALVSVVAEGKDAAAVVADLAAQLRLPLRDGRPTTLRPVTLRLEQVSLRTALQVLRETSGARVSVDARGLTLSGPALPEVKEAQERLTRDAQAGAP